MEVTQTPYSLDVLAFVGHVVELSCSIKRSRLDCAASLL